MRILLAIDDSQFSETAVEELGSRPWWGDTKFLILHVVCLPSVQQWEVWGMEGDARLREKLLADARTLVEDQSGLLKKLVAPGIEIESKVEESNGQVSDCILHEANEWGADLIVVGSHGRTGLQRFLLGSVAEGVLAQAPCSVEIIKSAKVHDSFKSKEKERESSGCLLTIASLISIVSRRLKEKFEDWI